MKNILESLDRPLVQTGLASQSFHVPLAPTSLLGMRQGQGGEAQGWGQGSRLPWQTRFMIWPSWGETEPAAIRAMKSSPVFLGGASVPKAGASIWPLCVVHLSLWSSGPGWPPSGLLNPLRPAPSFNGPCYGTCSPRRSYKWTWSCCLPGDPL